MLRVGKSETLKYVVVKFRKFMKVESRNDVNFFLVRGSKYWNRKRVCC